MRNYRVKLSNVATEIVSAGETPQEAIKNLFKGKKPIINLGDAAHFNAAVWVDNPMNSKPRVNYYYVTFQKTKLDIVTDKVAAIVKEMTNHRDVSTTYRLKLGYDDKGKDWGIVFAWQDGFEKEQDSTFVLDGTYCICGKVAYIKENSMMSEYDMDWEMPYDKKTGEVDDTETSIHSFEEIPAAVQWWIKNYKRFKKKYNLTDY